MRQICFLRINGDFGHMGEERTARVRVFKMVLRIQPRF
jgi:hypothetical protein